MYIKGGVTCLNLKPLCHILGVCAEQIKSKHSRFRITLIVFNATFNNISVILWWSILLVEETGDNHRPCASH